MVDHMLSGKFQDVWNKTFSYNIQLYMKLSMTNHNIMHINIIGLVP